MILLSVCLFHCNGRDRDPDRNSRDLSLEGSVPAPGYPGKLEVGTCPQVCQYSYSNLLNVSSGPFPFEPGHVASLCLPVLDGTTGGQHLSYLRHGGIIVHTGHSDHLTTFDAKSQALQLFQVPLDDIVAVFSIPCALGRQAVTPMSLESRWVFTGPEPYAS